MREFIKKYKISLAIVIFITAVLVLAYFLAIPLINSIAAKANTIQQKKNDKELNEKKLASVATMEEDFSKFKDNENKFNITTAPEKELDFIKELESLAGQTNNTIEFKVDDAVASKVAVKSKSGATDIKGSLKYDNFLTMQIALEGNYASLLNFINKVENYTNYVNIIAISSEKISVETSNNTSSDPFAVTDQSQNKKLAKETINSILDVVVYLKK